MVSQRQSIDLQHVPHSKKLEGGTPNVGSPRTTCTKMTFSRDWLIHIANETVEIGNSGKYVNRRGEEVVVKDALENAMNNSVHYHSSHPLHPSTASAGESIETFESRFYVCYGSSLDVATKLHNRDTSSGHANRIHIGILNSASGKNPGGKFFRGTISQEDCICRATLLYPCLLQYKDKPNHYYYVNNKPKYIQSSSSCAIFSPRVPVIRQDTMQGPLLDECLLFSFVSIPAPNAFVLGRDNSDSFGSDGDEDENNNNENNAAVVPKAQSPEESARNEAYDHIPLKDAMHDRCFRALCIFAEQGCTEVVLCAYGCGVHGNNPKEIADTFKDILANELKGRFRSVAFAIQPSRHANYKAFVETFPDAETTL